MIQRDVLFQVLDALDALNISYMVVGSFASNLWGRPRSTHDADMVAEIASDQAGPLAQLLEDSFYAPEFVIREVAQHPGRHFNAIHLKQPFKVDIWSVQQEPYDRERFQRRVKVEMWGRPVWVASPEDTILHKLVWYKISPALQRQYQDALEVYEIQEPNLEQAYLDRWAQTLNVHEYLDQIREEAARPEEG
jgi:hypothetical protein